MFRCLSSLCALGLFLSTAASTWGADRTPPERAVPDDAIGLNSIAQWKRSDATSGAPESDRPRWQWDNGVWTARPGFGDIITTNRFGDAVYHVDFLIPEASGSSSLVIDGKWEIQIVDSSGTHVTDDRNTCGAIFGVAAPRVNACAEPGVWQELEVAVKYTSPDAALISAWLNGRQIHDRVLVSEPALDGFISEASDFNENKVPALEEVTGEASNRLDMGGDFTVAVRFLTESGGPLLSKAPPTGIWEPNGKTLFIRDGRPVFDIGWLGAVAGDVDDLSDGQWHGLALTHRSGEVRMYVDGEEVAVNRDFTRPDDPDHIFKLGACATDFPDETRPFFEGAISHAVFMNKALTEEEVLGLGEGRIDEEAVVWGYESDDPMADYQALLKKSEQRRIAREEAALPGGPLRLQADRSAVRFANLWVRPLAEVDHAQLIESLNDSHLAAGREIYNSICITCHGNLEQEGSLPTSRKFWEAPFKNGNDPYSLFRTLGEGYGQMPQFPFLTARQRYDVIHYLREELVRPNNPEQYYKVNDAYLSSLPKGIGTEQELTDAMKAYAEGPQYLRMNFGPALNWTLQVEEGNIAYKGIAVRLDDGPGGVSKGNAWMLYDHDTMRVATAWTGDEFVDWKGIAFDGSHGTHTGIVGDRAFVNPVGPGWAHPETGSWDDPRFRGRDGKPYGPLPRDWVQYQGHYLYGNRMVVSYRVGDADVFESPGYQKKKGEAVFSRTLNIGRSVNDLTLRIAPEDVGVALAGTNSGSLKLRTRNGFQVLDVPAAATPANFKILMTASDGVDLKTWAPNASPAEDLKPYTRGGPARWDESVTTSGVLSDNDSGYVSDTLTVPHDDQNPWNAWMRLGGFDFLPGGTSAYVCTWMGDVWRVDGIEGDLSELTWTRVASGLFQPLGLLVRGEKIYVTCRDQIVELNDLNGDGEMDWYRCFNNDHQVTEHFHEFAMGLQEDKEGNFYYAKSARHALPALVEHHGTLLKVSADGSTTEILANGFRAANGVCLNPDGSFFVTDQEGHWTPKNRINRVEPGGFYGNMMGYHDRESSADEDMDPPLVWITNEMDRSPGELLWVPESARWGPLEGSLLNLSYGTGRIFVVLRETVGDVMQGGVVRLPIADFPTGVMRGRFHPDNGHLYACGMFAWAGNQQQAGGFYRVRYAGGPVHLPVELNAMQSGIRITFTDPLDPKSAVNPENYQVKAWDLKRTANYGSRHYNERSWTVESVELSNDMRSVHLTLPEIEPTWGMEIRYELMGEEGKVFESRIHNTIHRLPMTR